MPTVAAAGRRLRNAALLAVLIAVAYGASLRNDFVHDDGLFMDDPRVQSLGELPRLLWEARWGFEDRPAGRSIHQYYRPLEPLPYLAAHQLAGGAPWISHLLNLVFHLLNALLVLAALRCVLGDAGGALFGAVLFAVYPAYSEAVLWPAALGGLGAFSCTLAIFALNARPGGSRWITWLLSALLYGGALWFKETGILAPLFVFLYDLLLAPQPGVRRVWGRRWLYIALLPPLLFYAALRWLALGAVLPRLDYLPFTPLQLALNGLALVPQFARVLLWPFDLSFHHDFDPVGSAAERSVLIGAGLLVAAMASAAANWRSRPPVAFGVASMLVAASPYLVPHKYQDNVFAERYLYDVAFGACVLLGYGWTVLWMRLTTLGRRLAVALTAVLVVAFVLLDARRGRDWRDEVTLFVKTIAQAQRAELIRVNLGVRLLELGRHREGIAVLEELVGMAPDYRGAWHNLGLLYQAAGRSADALAAFESARGTDPFNTATLLNLGYSYDRLGRRDEALQAYFRLVEMAPRHADGWYNLAAVAFELGQMRNARAALERVLAADPGDAQAAALLRRLDTWSGERPPRTAAAARATSVRCAAARRAAGGGRYGEALARLKAAAWVDEISPLPHHYLANVHYLRGNLAAAVQHQRMAAELAPESDLYRRNLMALERELAAIGSGEQ